MGPPNGPRWVGTHKVTLPVKIDSKAMKISGYNSKAGSFFSTATFLSVTYCGSPFL